MPNHCSNNMYVKGSVEEINRFMETVLTEKESHGEKKLTFDFNKVMPMPPELMITAGGSVDQAISIIRYESDGDSRDLEQYKGYEWVKEELGDDPSYDDIVALLKDRMTDTEKEMEEGRQAIENLRKYRHKDWYSWCTDNANWGTKWGAYDHQWIYDDPTELTFDHDWILMPRFYLMS